MGGPVIISYGGRVRVTQHERTRGQSVLRVKLYLGHGRLSFSSVGKFSL